MGDYPVHRSAAGDGPVLISQNRTPARCGGYPVRRGRHIARQRAPADDGRDPGSVRTCSCLSATPCSAIRPLHSIPKRPSTWLHSRSATTRYSHTDSPIGCRSTDCFDRHSMAVRAEVVVDVIHRGCHDARSYPGSFTRPRKDAVESRCRRSRGSASRGSVQSVLEPTSRLPLLTNARDGPWLV